MFPYERLENYTFAQLLLELYRSVPELDAVVGPEGRISFAELATEAADLSMAFASMGVGPGERIGLLMPNGIRWMVTTLAAHIAGASVVPVNTWYRRTELADVIERSGVRLIIADREIFGHDFRADLESIGALAPRDRFAGTLFWPIEADRPDGLLPGIAVSSTEAHIADSPVTEASEGFLIFTSGSTASPKAVPLLQGCLVRNGFQMGKRQHLVVGDRLWTASPLFFGYGCANAVPVALTHGVALCLQERFVPRESLELIERECCTVYYGLAPMTRGLIADPDFDRFDISSLRTGTTGMTADDKRLAIEMLGVTEICSVYGLTEGYGHTTMTDARDPLDVKLETQGTVLPTQELRIVDTGGEVCDPGAIGEIQIRGCVVAGYLGTPDLNAASFTADGWFRTGDLAFVDAHQRLHFVGRLKEMIKVKGINVSPLEVESVIAEHPDVGQVFVFGLDSVASGEIIGCAIVRTDDATSSAEEFGGELRSWMKDRTASYKIPGRIMVLRNVELPLTATGKVSKKLLAEQCRNLGDPGAAPPDGPR